MYKIRSIVLITFGFSIALICMIMGIQIKTIRWISKENDVSLDKLWQNVFQVFLGIVFQNMVWKLR
jgi:hypothetical protein